MIGGIVGVGVFGMPYAFSRSGFATGLLTLALLALAMLALNLMYAELVLQTPGKHRLGGYVRTYLGERFALPASVVMMASLAGAMLAFMVVGGKFLSTLLSPALGGPEAAYAFAIPLFSLFASRRGVKLASKVETVVVGATLFLFAFIALSALPHASVGNLATNDPARALLPFGIVLFALTGAGIIPEMRDVLGARHQRLLPRAIVRASLVIALLYAAFCASVVGATGSATTEAAFDGLIPLLGRSFGLIAALLGSLTVTSIFLTHSVQLQQLLHVDHGMRRAHAWLVASLAAPALYLSGARDFISIISFVGSVLGGAIALLILATYETMRRGTRCRERRCLEVPVGVSWGIAVVFIIGIAIGIISL